MSDGLFASNDVCANANPNSSYFIRKDEPIIIDTLIANEVITDTIDLNGGILTTTGGTVLTLNGNPVGGGQVDTITGTAPITVTGTAIDPVISLADSTVVPATYTLATVTVNSKGLVTSASSNTIPPNDDWSNFPAQTPVNMNNFKITSLATPTLATDGATKGYIDGLDAQNVKLTGNQTIAGIKTFSSIPVCSTLPTSNDQLANKQYVDSVIGADTLANVLIAGNSAGANQINMNNNKIIGLATPTLATDAVTKGYTDGLDAQNVKLTGDQTIAGIKTFSSVPVCSTLPTTNSQLTNKQYVDSVAGVVPTLGQVLTAGNTASGDINMNDFDISSVNDITMSGLAPTITATNVLGNMTLSALGTFNALTGGQMTLASGGIMSIGGATHTSIENVRIDNSVITKDSGADLQIGNVQSITNVGAPLALSATQVNVSTLSNGNVNVTPNGSGKVNITQTVSGVANTLVKLESVSDDAPGVYLEMYKNSASPAVNDRLGVITFQGNNSVGTKKEYARFRSRIRDPTDASEDGEIDVFVSQAGSMVSALEVKAEGVKPLGGIIDGTDSLGTAGQVLSSTGTGLEWVTTSGGYAGTVETLSTSGLISSLVENTQISGVGTYTLQPGTTPNQRKIVTLLPSLPKAMRKLFTGFNGSQGLGTITCAVYDPILNMLYFGGSFNNTIDGVPRRAIASYSFGTGLFYSLGSGISGTGLVSALYLDSSIQRLYVGGSFINAGGVTNATRFARFDITGVGTGTWGTLSSNFPSNGQVNAIAKNATDFYIGGTFTTFSTAISNATFFARYNIATGTYFNVGTGISSNATVGGQAVSVNSLFMDGTRLYIGGTFTGVAGIPNTPNICYFDIASPAYISMGRGSTYNIVNSIDKYAGEIVVGGTIDSVIQTAGSVLEVNRVASWNPTTGVWKAIGDSLVNTVLNVKVFDGELYAVGSFSQLINSQDASDMRRIAKWEPSTNKWRSFGGVNGQVNDMLKIGGEFAIFGNFNRTFTFDSFGQNDNACLITPANFTIINGSVPGLLTNNGFATDYYLVSGQNTVNSMQFIWDATGSKWINTRTAETLPNS